MYNNNYYGYMGRGYNPNPYGLNFSRTYPRVIKTRSQNFGKDRNENIVDTAMKYYIPYTTATTVAPVASVLGGVGGWGAFEAGKKLAGYIDDHYRAPVPLVPNPVTTAVPPDVLPNPVPAVAAPTSESFISRILPEQPLPSYFTDNLETVATVVPAIAAGGYGLYKGYQWGKKLYKNMKEG